MGSLPIYDQNNPIHRQALELFGRYIRCGFLLCGEADGHPMVYVNEALPRSLGYGRTEFFECFSRFGDCIHPEDRQNAQDAAEKALEDADQYDLVYRVLDKQGYVLWMHESGRRVEDPDGKRYLFCLLTDITGDAKARQTIEQQSKTDALTGALNRAAITERVDKLLGEMPRALRNHALILMNLDHFRKINDAFGRSYGDKTLEDVSRSLKTLIRAGDMLGRLDGDTFVLCLKDISPDDAVNKRMGQICTLLRKSLSPTVKLSCSLGVAFYPRDGRRFNDLLRCAEIALAQAKKAGRDRFEFYRPEMAAEDSAPEDAQA